MKKNIIDNKQLQALIHDVSDIAQYLWQKGWAERNAGNISINLDTVIKKDVKNLHKFPVFKLSRKFSDLAGKYFFVTGTGKRMRDLARDPMRNACIIKVSDTADQYHLISMNKDLFYELRPTSELPSHLAIHQMLAQRGSSYKVIIHTHPNELVALTHSPEFKDEVNLNKTLWGMHPEAIIVVPKGIGMVPFLMPGTDSIADATVKALQNHDIIVWEKHGCLAIGDQVFETFDLIDTLSKSAQIYLLCKSAGIQPEGLTEEQLRDLKIQFNIYD